MGLEEIRRLKFESGLPKPKKFSTIAKKSAKRIAKEKAEMEAGTDEALDRWFEARRKEMKGRCQFCNGKTEKENDETFRRSIAHLLPKRDNMFPSVATNENNWLELCFYGESCHTNFDNNIISLELLHDSAEWKIIAEKFKRIFPFIVDSEKKNIHPLLLKEIQ